MSQGVPETIPGQRPSPPSSRARLGIPQLQGQHPLGDCGSSSVCVPHNRASGSNPRSDHVVDALSSWVEGLDFSSGPYPCFHQLLQSPSSIQVQGVREKWGIEVG